MGRFETLSKARLSEIASMGGKAAHAKGTAHTWTRAEAIAAAMKSAATRRRKARERQQQRDS